MQWAIWAAAAALLATSAGAARGGEFLVGAYAHDVTFIGDAIGVGAAGREDGVDLHLGVRSDRIEAFEIIGRPQAHAFVSINSEGTSNFVAAGLSWPIDVTDRAYVRPGLGLAYTDGKVDLPRFNEPGLPPAEIARRLKLYNTRIDFGSHVLFQPEIAIGFRLSERVSAELSWVHISNGNILGSGKNQGMDDAGVRLIYAF